MNKLRTHSHRRRVSSPVKCHVRRWTQQGPIRLFTGSPNSEVRGCCVSAINQYRQCLYIRVALKCLPACLPACPALPCSANPKAVFRLHHCKCVPTLYYRNNIIATTFQHCKCRPFWLVGLDQCPDATFYHGILRVKQHDTSHQTRTSHPLTKIISSENSPWQNVVWHPTLQILTLLSYWHRL